MSRTSEPDPPTRLSSGAPFPTVAALPAAVSRRKVLRWLVLGNVVAVVLVVLGCALALQATRATLMQRALNASEELADGLRISLSGEIGRVDMALQTLELAYLRHSRSGPIDLEAFGQIVEEQRLLVPAIDRLRLTDASGFVRTGQTQASDPPVNLADKDLFIRAREATGRGLFVSEPIRHGAAAQWSLVLARRLNQPDGSFAGLVYASVPSQHFQDMFAAMGIDGNGAISLSTTGLKLVARHASQGGPAIEVGGTHPSTRLKQALALNPAEGTYIVRAAIDQVERAHAYRRVGEYPLVVIVGLATDDFLAPSRRDAVLVSALALLMTVGLVVSSASAYRAWCRKEDADRALRLEAQRLRAFMLTAGDGIHVLDRDGQVVELSDSFAAMLGRSRDEVLGMRIAQWDAGLTADQVREHMASFQVGDRREFATRHRRLDGHVFDVDVTSVGVHINGRDLLYCSARDTTHRRRAEQALRDSEAFLDRTGRVANVGGWRLNLFTNELTWSDQACRIRDVPPGHRPTPEEAMAAYPPEVRSEVIKEGINCLLSGEPWDMELPLTTATGRSIWVRLFGEVEYENNRPARIVGALQDITELHERIAELQQEQALRSQIERHVSDLDELLRERGEMLDVLAHEVRQPLNNASAALQGAAAALAEVDEQVASFRLTRAQTVMGQVLARIDNTLAVAALLANTEPIVVEDTDIDTLISVAIADMPVAERRRIGVERATATRTASMDMSLMRLALRNLLSNALKFSPETALVIIRVSDMDDPLALVIEVIDAGPGVEPELVPTLFHRGTRGRGARGTSGHGLGLYIVRRVMELHGGRVDLAANTSGGARVRLVIAQTDSAGGAPRAADVRVDGRAGGGDGGGQAGFSVARNT